MRFPLTHQNTSYPTRASAVITIHHKDCLYATAAKQRGYARLFIENNPEGAPHVIVTSDGCMTRSTPLPTGCAPSDVGLFTGWRGDRPCACAADVANDPEGMSFVLNCALTHSL